MPNRTATPSLVEVLPCPTRSMGTGECRPCGALVYVILSYTVRSPVIIHTSKGIDIVFAFRQLPSSQVVVGNMQEEIKKATLAIVYYGLDLWTCKVPGRHGLERGLKKAGGRGGLGATIDTSSQQ